MPTIEQLERSELERLKPLWIALFEHHTSLSSRPALDPETSWQRRRTKYEHLFLNHPDAFVLVGREAGADIGYAMTSMNPPNPTWITSDPVAELQTLTVLPEFRGQGLGSQLLNAVRRRIEQLGIRDLMIGVISQNQDALRFYEREGFSTFSVYLTQRFPE